MDPCRIPRPTAIDTDPRAVPPISPSPPPLSFADCLLVPFASLPHLASFPSSKRSFAVMPLRLIRANPSVESGRPSVTRASSKESNAHSSTWESTRST